MKNYHKVKFDWGGKELTGVFYGVTNLRRTGKPLYVIDVNGSKYRVERGDLITKIAPVHELEGFDGNKKRAQKAKPTKPWLEGELKCSHCKEMHKFEGRYSPNKIEECPYCENKSKLENWEQWTPNSVYERETRAFPYHEPETN